MAVKPLTFLVVEDDDVDYWAAERALGNIGFNNPVVRAYDGLHALDMIRGENEETAINEPLMILLDLNMPRMGGLEFLERLNSDPIHSHIPIIVVTTSELQEDIRAAYGQNICGYVVKCDIEGGLKEIIDDLKMPKALTLAA